MGGTCPSNASQSASPKSDKSVGIPIKFGPSSGMGNFWLDWPHLEKRFFVGKRVLSGRFGSIFYDLVQKRGVFGEDLCICKFQIFF